MYLILLLFCRRMSTHILKTAFDTESHSNTQNINAYLKTHHKHQIAFQLTICFKAFSFSTIRHSKHRRFGIALMILSISIYANRI